MDIKEPGKLPIDNKSSDLAKLGNREEQQNFAKMYAEQSRKQFLLIFFLKNQQNTEGRFERKAQKV